MALELSSLGGGGGGGEFEGFRQEMRSSSVSRTTLVMT